MIKTTYSTHETNITSVLQNVYAVAESEGDMRLEREFHLIDGEEHYHLTAKFLPNYKVEYAMCPLDLKGRVLPDRIEIDRPKELIIGFEHHSVIYLFSEEILKGLNGLRQKDHTLTEDLLKKCLKKKTASLRKEFTSKPINLARVKFHFHNRDSGQVLRLIVEYHPLSQKDPKKLLLNVITAFYPNLNVLKYDQGLPTETQYENWVKALPTISS